MPSYLFGFAILGVDLVISKKNMVFKRHGDALYPVFSFWKQVGTYHVFPSFTLPLR